LPDLQEFIITIGRQSYPVETRLNDDRFKRINSILRETCTEFDQSLDQEKLLALTCLQLAYKLEKISGSLRSLDKRLNDLILEEKLKRGATR